MPHLVVHEPGGVSSSVSVDRPLRIGRENGLEIVLADGKASRHHASIERDPEGWAVLDAGSRHGTFVNAERVDRRVLADGDQIQIGATVLTFHTGDDVSAVVQLATTEARGDERVLIFYHLAEATAAIDDSDTALRKALAAIVSVLGCDRGVIALGDKPATLRRAAEVSARELVVGRAVIEAVLGRGEAVLLRGAEVAATLQGQGVRSAIAAPLRVADRTLGLVYVDDRGRTDRFERGDLELLVAVARLAGVIVDVAARYERAVALATGDGIAPELLGKSDAMRGVRRDVELFAATELPIVLAGESGVGKELVARALHATSARRGEAFVAVNCAAMPDSLLESELFGHVRGAFTGADRARRGKLVVADRGTLFLDEVADLSLAAQAKLLRVLEDGEVVPVGAEHAVRIDLRVVAASHKDLRVAVADGRFRQDLYYRLAGAEIAIPPLRERDDDVVELSESFLARIRQRRAAPSRFAADALAAIRAYPWPGNVRELRHAIERACAIASGDAIAAGDLALRPPPRDLAVTSGTLATRYAALDTTERALVEEAMADADNNVSEAARLLGITRIMMKRRLDKLGE